MARPEREELQKRLEFSEHRRALLQNRLSKGGIEEDATLWSFVDLMTLLLILFILFYSHALNHKSSEKNVSTISSPPAAAPSFMVHKTSMDTNAVAYDPYPSKGDVFKTGALSQQASFEQLEQKVWQALSEKVKKDLSIRWNQKRLVLVLGERIAFNVGDADLLPDFKPILKRIAEFISPQKGYKVAVAGHTDDKPIHTVQFPSNWELSAIRAVNVAKFLILHGVDPHRISIEGYSAYRPLLSNSTAQNRQANRRVEITLIKEPETGKAAENTGTISAPASSLKQQSITELSTHPKKRYPAFPGYPF